MEARTGAILVKFNYRYSVFGGYSVRKERD